RAPTDEKFRIEGGVLQFNAGDFVPADPIVIAGGRVGLPIRSVIPTAVVAEGVGGSFFGSGQASSWTGGSTGVGNLGIGGALNVDAPLNHQGDLTLERAQLNVANGYTGNTYVTGTSAVNHSGALSHSPLVKIQSGAWLTLNAIPDGPAQYVV